VALVLIVAGVLVLVGGQATGLRSVVPPALIVPSVAGVRVASAVVVLVVGRRLAHA
jgi:hypothetical protein